MYAPVSVAMSMTSSADGNKLAAVNRCTGNPCAGGNIWLSIDAGITWTPSPSPNYFARRLGGPSYAGLQLHAVLLAKPSAPPAAPSTAAGSRPLPLGSRAPASAPGRACGAEARRIERLGGSVMPRHRSRQHGGRPRRLPFRAGAAPKFTGRKKRTRDKPVVTKKKRRRSWPTHAVPTRYTRGTHARALQRR